jgi:hypothetical protein
MKMPSRIVIATAVLLSGVSLAAAADMSKATDQLSLNSSQQKTAWQDISSQAVKETPPASFSANVGQKVPDQLAIHPVPINAADQVPALRPYSYAYLDSNKLLIVNPTDRKVAQVITQ